MTSSTRRANARWKDILSIVCVIILIIILAGILYFLWSWSTSARHIKKQHQRVASAPMGDGPPPYFSEEKQLEELQNRVREKGRKLSVDVAEAESRRQLEYFTPVKVGTAMPLHEHDVLYGEDELWRATHQHRQPNSLLKQHNSGHFRLKDQHIWDPHPQYEFTAFGRHFRLELELDSEASFASPGLRAHHVAVNSSSVLSRPLHADAQRCFYKGRVLGDAQSRVRLDLCHGMRGYIHTSRGVFFVEPYEHWPVDNSTDPTSSPSVLHAMYPLNRGSPQVPDQTSAVPADQESHCALPHADIDDDESLELGGTLSGVERHFAGVGSDEPIINATLHRSKRFIMDNTFPQVSSKQLYIAVKIVTDKKMSEYHGDGLSNYILSLMFTVSSVFKDASIGNHINIVLVDFESRPDKSFYSPESAWYNKYNTQSSNDVWATDMLKKFCQWQADTRQTLDMSRNYDTALLLTRENLCRYSNLTSCGTLGLAEVGAVCNPRKSCSIVQDNGLSAAFTIAHELGHVLNMKHDNDLGCKRFMEPTGVHYMMAHMLGENTYPWAWSNCSRHYLTDFLEAGHGFCLEDKPNSDLARKEEGNEYALPGESFTHDRQCEMLYGAGSQICTYMPTCGSLWCSHGEQGEKNGCLSQHIPWADGTRCAYDSWCQRGECVKRNPAALQPRDGSWSSWGPWGKCSRTCGGGIRQSRRECDSPRPEHGGRYCIGQRVRYESCETQECPYGSRDFREMQCAQFNSHGGKKWTAKYFSSKPQEQCKLYCRGHQSDYHYLFADKVIDGTPCKPKDYDVCVNGKCHSAGCDHRLGSSKTLDSCGVCDGDNSTCEVVKGSYNVSAPEYQRVVVIPAGSTNINIQQTTILAQAENNGMGDNIHLALRNNDTGDYILNGGYNVRPYHSRLLDAGAPISYTGARAEVEILNSTLEPVKIALVLEVFIVGKPVPPNIEYSYTVHYPYIWKNTSDWSSCKPCIRTRTLACVDSKTGHEVDKKLCAESKHRKPEWQRTCSHCPFYWKGNKCIQIVNGQEKEREKKYCGKRWVFGSWSKCEVSCNPGNQTRLAKCMSQRHKQLSDISCDLLKPEDTSRPCERVCVARWHAGNWTPCSNQCGHGERKRPLWCDQDGHTVSDHFCAKHAKHQPRTQQNCYETAGCEAHWTTSPPSQCSVTCGVGVAQRQVMCIVPILGNRPASNDSACSNVKKPSELVECSMAACKSLQQTERPSHLGVTAAGSSTTAITGRPSILLHDNQIIPRIPSMLHPHVHVAWIEESWSECSVSCGIGVRRRLVQCWDVGQHQLLADAVCERLAPRPSVEQQCTHTCGLWKPRQWQPCSVSCGKGLMVRDIECEAEWARLLLPDTACSSQERPVSQAVCEETVCPSDQSGDKRWSTGPWGECIVSSKSECGPGQHRRQVKCLHGVCEGVAPPDTEPCSLPCLHAMWNYGDWGSCTRACGGGWRHRLVRCQSVQGAFLEEETCANLEKPDTREECNSQRCIGYRWKTGPWGQCSERCGRGFKYRAIQCVTTSGGATAAGHPVESYFCGGLTRKPAQSRGCYRYQCPFAWQIGEWSECSATCGAGAQQRQVSCHRVSTLGWLEVEPVDAVQCAELEQPISQQACQLESCSALYHWSAGAWSQCSAVCGKRGRQRRAVHCLSRDGTRVPSSLCREEMMPNRRRKCNMRKCPGASTCKEARLLLRGTGPIHDGSYILTILGKNVTIYCHDMSGHHPREYLTLPSGEGENYSEFYHLSLRETSTCPNNGHRWDHCPCVPESKGLSGTTVFTKIRLNVHTMRVKTDDFTFARMIRGKRRIPYGEAGDCYSHVECPQGRFSVNLSNTPFRVSAVTGWLSNGSMVQRTDEEHQKVWGKCGGMCGTCSPRKETGLKLDLVSSSRHARHHWRS